MDQRDLKNLAKRKRTKIRVNHERKIRTGIAIKMREKP